jgi:NADH-quinone oxidoreductase subunit J
MNAPFLFLFFAALTVLGALWVVLAPQPLGSAFALIVTFLGLGGLYCWLQNTFLGVLQVLVYAGAVMVLFVFIIMLFDDACQAAAHSLSRAKPSAWGQWPVAVGVAALLGAVAYKGVPALWYAFGSTVLPPVTPQPYFALGIHFCARFQDLACVLFAKYLLPIQVVGFLLLMAVVGILMIAKPHAKPPAGSDHT